MGGDPVFGAGQRSGDVIRDIREMLEALKKDGSDLSHLRAGKDSRCHLAISGRDSVQVFGACILGGPSQNQ